MGQLLKFQGTTTVDLDPVEMLENIKSEGYENVIVIGDRDGVTLHGSSADLYYTLAMLEVAKSHVMDMING